MSRSFLSFPREWILKKPSSFRNLCRDGIRLKGESITVIHRPSGDRPFRVGFSTRKNLAGAVGRNRARRLMREAVRLHQHEIRKDIELLLIWHGPVGKRRFADAEQEIMGLLRRGGLLV